MQFTKPIPFEEAVERLGAKTVAGAKLDTAAWQRVPLALRERAFFSAKVEDARFLADLKGWLQDFQTSAREDVPQPDGTTVTALKVGSRAQFVELARRKALALGLDRVVDPEQRGGLQDITSERRLGLIFDVQTEQANSFGDWQQGMDADVLNEFPAWRFIRVGEPQAPRPVHQAHVNEVRLKTDLEFWRAMNDPSFGGFGVPWGPWGFGSLMDTEDVDRGEAESLGLLQPGQRLEPATRDFNEGLKASVRSLDEQLQAWLQAQLGDSVKLEDGAAWWKGDRTGKALAGVPPRSRRAPAAPVPAEFDEQGFPTDLARLEKVRALGGSTGAELVRDPRSGRLYVRKEGNSPEHVREEFTADQLYRAAGVPVPAARLYDGAKPVKLAEFVEGQTLQQYLAKATPAQRDAVIGKLRGHFAVDALLGNWDVTGTGLDNVLVDKAGTPWRIDNGGSLRFRAQGTAKTAKEWHGYPTELWTMRAPGQLAGKVFHGLGFYDVARQLETLPGAAILAAAPADLRDTLAARLAELAKVARKARDFESTQYVAAYADRVCEQMMALRNSDVFRRLSRELVQEKAGDYVLRDENGLPFDHLRTLKGNKVADVSQNYFEVISKAAISVNSHHKKGDLAYNATSLQAALKLQPELEKMALEGTAPQQELAGHYLQSLKAIVAAQGNLKATVPMVTKHAWTPPDADGKSVVAAFAEWMQEHGGDWNVVSQWAGAQAGSSKSEASRAWKWHLLQQLDGAKVSEFHNPPTKSDLDKVRKQHGDKYERSLDQFHAFVQEVLERLTFPGSDREQRLVRLLRTETTASAVTIPKGQTGEYKRGVNESGSLYTPIFNGARTVTAVPFTRITSLYFFERTPGTGGSLLLGDGENEATYIGWKLRTLNLGELPKGKVPLKTTTNRKDWEL
jgi:hypothetical protein